MRFIGVSFGVIDRKLVCIATSEGYSVLAPEGLTSANALAFMSSVRLLRESIGKTLSRGQPKPALVMFDSAIDIELLLQDTSKHTKDILFGLYRAAEKRNEDLPIFDPFTPEYRGVADVYGFRISMLPGKLFKIQNLNAKKKGRLESGIMFNDIAGFFECDDINAAAEKFLKVSPLDRISKDVMPLWEVSRGDAILSRCGLEAKLVVRLADKVDKIVQPLGVTPRQWYGPSAIAARCLGKWEARKQAKRLHEKNSPHELIKAIDCAYFGGRVEALKLGTIRDVKTYDLNSAYAYATTLLSQFYTPLRFVRRYKSDAPFSCWLVRYALPDSVSLGVLPTRHNRGGISFRREGLGYFWQPEVDYLRQRYPDSFEVKWGYVGPEYKPVTFAEAVRDMYLYRNELKAQGDAGESIIKLALSNLYGKFAQNTGSAHFQCRAWAGWITSFVRRLLLEAVTGAEDSVICFCQDAVHMAGASANESVEIGEALGEWKAKSYASGLYVSPGIYTLTEYGEDPKQKSAQRGSNLGLDFNRIATDLSERQVSELTRSFFVGWQLARQAPVKFGGQYLQDVEESLKLIPSKLRARNYLSEFNWLTEYRDSEINSRFNGQLSARYVPNDGVHSGALRLRLKDRGWL